MKKIIYLLVLLVAFPGIAILILQSFGVAFLNYWKEISLILVIIAAYIFCKNCGRKLPWFEIIDPFNFSLLSSVYNDISNENKVAFWNIAVSFVVAILTAWLGFTVSKSIQTNNEQMNTEVMRYQIIDRFGPMYERYSMYMKPLFWDIKDFLDGGSKDKETFYQKNGDKILQTTDSILILSTPILPYLKKNDRTDMENNNCALALGSYTIRKMGSNISKEQFKDSLKEYLRKPEIDRLIGYNTNRNSVIESLSSYKERVNNMGNNYSYLFYDIFILPQMRNNLEIISSLISSTEERANPFWNNISILLCAYLIGYVFFRILILKVFRTGER